VLGEIAGDLFEFRDTWDLDPVSSSIGLLLLGIAHSTLQVESHDCGVQDCGRPHWRDH
jgi:hypothetical protein